MWEVQHGVLCNLIFAGCRLTSQRGEMRCTREGRLGLAVAEVAAEEGQGEDRPPCSLKTQLRTWRSDLWVVADAASQRDSGCDSEHCQLRTASPWSRTLCVRPQPWSGTLGSGPPSPPAVPGQSSGVLPPGVTAIPAHGMRARRASGV